MKKLLFALAALGAMSCSQNEITESFDEQNEIKFANVQMGNSIITKAEPLTGNESFGVYAYYTTAENTTPVKYFENDQLLKSGDLWGLSGGKRYYPTVMNKMYFLGYGKVYDENKPTSIVTAENTVSLQYTNYSVEDQTSFSKYENFVITKEAVAAAKPEVGVGVGVALTFTHALSKIQFKAQVLDEATHAKVDARITGIKATANVNGNLNFTTEYLWTSSKSNEFTVGLVESNPILTTTPAPVSLKSLYVIPNQSVGVNVTADLFNAGSDIKVGTVTGSATIDQTNFVINNSVTVNIIIKRSSSADLTEITFADPVIEDWKPVDADITPSK
jgi:hypothetical protein